MFSARTNAWRQGALLVVVFTALAVVGITAHRRHGEVAQMSPVPTLSLATVMQRAHFAFQKDGEVWNGGHTTYTARVDATAVELTAFNGERERGSPLRVVSSHIERGGRRIDTEPRAPRRDVEGALEIERGPVVEHLRNGPDGLSQSWAFATRPEGPGELVVRLKVDAKFLGTTASGLHFSTGSLGFTYGHATWVDAKGTRTAVPAQFEEGTIALRVSAKALDEGVYPAVLDPLISPEITLDVPVYAPALNNQEAPSIAWNGTRYLAAWTDGRVGGLRYIMGARLDASGTVLDPAGITISNNSDSNQGVAVASNGSDFMVVWSDYAGSGPANIFRSRVTSAGVSLDPQGSLVYSAGGSVDATHPSIAWGNNAYLVAWDEQDSNNPVDSIVRGVRIDSTGAKLGSVFSISAAGFNSFADVDYDGTNFLVVYHRNTATADVLGAFVSGAGVASPPFTICSNAGNQYSPSVAWNGTTHLVAWHDDRNAGVNDIYAARVSSAGVVADSTGFVVSSASGAQTETEVTARGNGGFYVVWQDARAGADIYGAQVTNAAVVSPANGGVVSSAAGTQVAPAVASDGTSVMAVWADFRSPLGNSDIYGTLINAAGTVVSPAGVLISQSAAEQLTPAVAFDGTNYLVVWEDQRVAGASDIYGIRISPSRVLQDAAAFPISTAANTQRAPAVTWTGSNYFVVWQDDRTSANNFDIYGARVTSAVLVSDPAGIPISTAANNQTGPDVASDGSNVLVVWQDERTSTVAPDISGARVGPTGTVLDGTGISINTQPNRQANPAVAYNGTTYLVVWDDTRSSPTQNIYGARVATGGTVTDPVGIIVATGAVGSWRRNPAIAANGATFFVAWEASTGPSPVDLYGARISGTVSALDSQALALGTQASNQLAPAVAADGTNFQVVWVDQRSGNSDIYGSRVVASNGALLDGAGTGFVIAAGNTDETAPAVVGAGARRFLVAYQAFQAASTINAQRAAARTLSNAPPVATAASVSVNEDTSLPVTLGASDADGDAVTFTVTANPSNGSLSGTPPSLTYTPNANFYGIDSFTFKANDTIVDSALATVSIIVNPVNDPPLANGQSASTPEDTSKSITLTGSDVENSPLTYTVVTQPTQGSLSGVAPNLTYTPFLNYNGPDAFTFKVNDGSLDSLTTATVSLTVIAVNDPPAATPQSVSTNEDTALPITLTGTDVEGSPLTFAIVAQPPNGSLSGTPPNVTYTPTANYFGNDAFSFTTNDGAATSAASTISIIVNRVNDPPVAQSQSLGTPQDTALSLTLGATDIDLDVLSYIIVTGPTHGTLSTGTASARTYTPSAGYKGGDSFTFKANDGFVDSNVATVNIAVASVNHAPVATPQSVITSEETPKALTLAGTDADGDALTFSITQQPAHGILTGTGASVTYTPTLNYNGSDNFTFRVNDGQFDSSPALVALLVTPVNDPPVPTAQTVSTLEDTPLSIVLAGTDVDGNALTFSVAVGPSHGALSGTPPNLTYTPALNYNGTDGFAFKANDGTVDSPGVATVTIVVGAVNDAPVANSQSVSTAQDVPKFFMLGASDADGDFLFYSIVTNPAHGTLMGTSPNLTYLPATGYVGTDSFTFKVNDGQQDSAVATVSLSIGAVNHAPTVSGLDVTLDEDTC